jgi:hypothetical protein
MADNNKTPAQVSLHSCERLTVYFGRVVQITFIIDRLIDLLPDVETQSGRLSLESIASITLNAPAATSTFRADNIFSNCNVLAFTVEAVK